MECRVENTTGVGKMSVEESNRVEKDLITRGGERCIVQTHNIHVEWIEFVKFSLLFLILVSKQIFVKKNRKKEMKLC